jgi:hypothetical protein
MPEYPRGLFQWPARDLDVRFPISGRRPMRRRSDKSQWAFTENVTLLPDGKQATAWYYLDMNGFISLNIRGRIGNDDAYYNYDQLFINPPFPISKGKPYSFPFIEGCEKRFDVSTNFVDGDNFINSIVVQKRGDL